MSQLVAGIAAATVTETLAGTAAGTNADNFCSTSNCSSLFGEQTERASTAPFMIRIPGGSENDSIVNNNFSITWPIEYGRPGDSAHT